MTISIQTDIASLLTLCAVFIVASIVGGFLEGMLSTAYSHLRIWLSKKRKPVTYSAPINVWPGWTMIVDERGQVVYRLGYTDHAYDGNVTVTHAEEDRATDER